MLDFQNDFDKLEEENEQLKERLKLAEERQCQTEHELHNNVETSRHRMQNFEKEIKTLEGRVSFAETGRNEAYEKWNSAVATANGWRNQVVAANNEILRLRALPFVTKATKNASSQAVTPDPEIVSKPEVTVATLPSAGAGSVTISRAEHQQFEGSVKNVIRYSKYVAT